MILTPMSATWRPCLQKKNEGCLAIITARGASKRIPRKNIRPFLGKPIISYPLRAALDSACFSEVMVSTDDAEIAEVSRGFGAQVPFMRSASASSDTATSEQVLAEVLNSYAKSGKNFAFACCIYPTAVFLTPQLLRDGYAQLCASDADSLTPVVRFSYPIQRALSLKNGQLRMLWPENENVRSQDLPPAFHDGGQFYWFRPERFLATNSIFSSNALGIEVDELHAQDIDTETDWALAEAKYALCNKEKR